MRRGDRLQKWFAHPSRLGYGKQLPTSLLKRDGGVFEIGAVVDLGATQHSGSPPEVEDYVFDPQTATRLKSTAPDKFWNLIRGIAQGQLVDIFGPDLQKQRRGCATDVGAGTASLGCLLSGMPPMIYINNWNKIRAKVTDANLSVDLSVTDLRLYENDQRTPRANAVADVQRRVDRGIAVILSVGLARAFRVENDTARRHWLQVNNFHLEDAPLSLMR